MTDSQGHYSFPCHGEKLLASSWPVGIYPPNLGGGPVPGSAPTRDPGPSYTFSGGATDITHAAIVKCDGQPVDFVIPEGGTVDIQFDASLLVPRVPQIPPDNLYIPGLGAQASIVIAVIGDGINPPAVGNDHQIISRLGAGVLRIDGTIATLSCTGNGVTNDPTIAGATVIVIPGQTTFVFCKRAT